MQPLSAEDEKALLALCDTGRLYAVEAWIRAGRSLVGSGSRATPLETAMCRGFPSLVELLLRHETSQAAKNAALARAVADRRADLAALTVSYGADVRGVPFADALYSWSRDIVTLFLAHGADPVADHPFAWAFVERIRTALGAYLEAKRARPDLAEALQAQLDMAVRKHAHDANLKWVSLLMWAGANPRSRGPMLDEFTQEDDPESYTTALHEACYSGHPAVLRRLKPDPAQDVLGELLCEAARWGHVACARVLLSLGARMVDVPDGGSAALSRCLWHLDWEQRPWYGRTAREGAPPSDSRAAMQLLIEQGAIWRPDRQDLRYARQALYRQPASVTIELVTALVSRHACDDAVIHELLRPSKMQERLVSLQRPLGALGFRLNGRRKPADEPPPVPTRPGDRPPSRWVRRSFDREQLYREIWAEPTRTVAARYGVSDVRLSVICGQLQIPKPPRGYWAKRAAGVKLKAAPPLKPFQEPKPPRRPR